MDILSIAERRKSIRNYKSNCIENKYRNHMTEYLSKNNTTPFNSDCYFQMLTTTSENEKIKIGTYGFIKGATDFIIGSVTKNDEKSLIDYGYLFEKIIFEATHLGLGTCILGLTFNKKQFYKKVSIPDNHWIPAITPIGLANKNEGFKNKIIRGIFKSSYRKDFNELFFKENSNTPLEIEESIRLPFEILRLAPSAKNDQPWRIIESGNKYHFFLCLRESLSNEKKINYLNLIDIGIAMYHFEEGFKEIGYYGEWSKSLKDINVVEPTFKYICSFNPTKKNVI